MKPSHLASAAFASASAASFYVISIYAPDLPLLDGKLVNAYKRAFVAGASTPSTHCGLKDPHQCPDGAATLVNADMSVLAAAVPGGQGIYVVPDGSVTYSVAHSALRPPGSQAGGFYASQVASESSSPSTIISWRSKAGQTGMWICPASPVVPITSIAVIKASTSTFSGQGCLPVAGLRIEPAGSDFGAWEYT